MYTLKEVSEMTGLTEHTLRYYTDLDLIPTERSVGNHRMFNDESMNWLKIIMCLRHGGMSLKMIKEYCELCMQEQTRENLEKRYNIILEQRDIANQKLAEAKECADFMEYKVKYYENILSGKVADIHVKQVSKY